MYILEEKQGMGKLLGHNSMDFMAQALTKKSRDIAVKNALVTCHQEMPKTIYPLTGKRLTHNHMLHKCKHRIKF